MIFNFNSVKIFGRKKTQLYIIFTNYKKQSGMIIIIMIFKTMIIIIMIFKTEQKY